MKQKVILIAFFIIVPLFVSLYPSMIITTSSAFSPLGARDLDIDYPYPRSQLRFWVTNCVHICFSVLVKSVKAAAPPLDALL